MININNLKDVMHTVNGHHYQLFIAYHELGTVLDILNISNLI